MPTNPERPVEQTSPPARPTAPSESAPPAPPSLVQLHADEAVSQLIGTTYRRSPPGDLEQLGDFVVPEGSRLVGGASLSDSVHGVEWYRFRPGEIVVLLTKDLDVATPGGRDSQIVAGVSADAADEEFVLNGCSIGDRRQEDVLAVVASPRQLPEGASTTQVPASAAWRFDPSGETISALDASSVTCELVNP